MILQQFTDEFIERYSGKQIGFPGNSYMGECLSLVKQFIKEYYLIAPPASGCNGARCYWSEFPNPLGHVLKKVPNTPDLVPKKGWIAVWDENTGGGYGHIGIVVNATKSTFTSFDQNWGGRHAHLVAHNYDHVYGFLVPLRETIEDNSSEKEDMADNRSPHDAQWVEEQLMHLKNERQKNEQLAQQINQQKTEIASLNDKLKIEYQLNADYRDEIIALQEEINQLSKTPAVKIDKEVGVAGSMWQINGVQVDSDGKITANYAKK